jgi:hypothetical protein
LDEYKEGKMGLFKRLFGKKLGQDETGCITQAATSSSDTNKRRISDIKKTLETAEIRHQLPELDQIVDALVAVEETTNYATLVEIALETAAEIRGIYIGELKSAYAKLWWQWHNHRDDPKYRAKKVIVITGEAAQVHPDSEIGWMLISILLVWFGKGCPDRSDDLSKCFGNVPSLEEIMKYQRTA